MVPFIGSAGSWGRSLLRPHPSYYHGGFFPLLPRLSYFQHLSKKKKLNHEGGFHSSSFSSWTLRTSSPWVGKEEKRKKRGNLLLSFPCPFHRNTSTESNQNQSQSHAQNKGRNPWIRRVFLLSGGGGVCFLFSGGLLYYFVFPWTSSSTKNQVYDVMTWMLLHLSPETAHEVAIQVLKYTPSQVFKLSLENERKKKLEAERNNSLLQQQQEERLKNSLGWENPIGLAAGFDKHGEALLGLASFGFGAIEIGSVTPLPQPGNPKPRVFRLSQDQAIINRYGFNSKGHDVVYQHLLQVFNTHHKTTTQTDPQSWSPLLGCHVGVNLGRNKTPPPRTPLTPDNNNNDQDPHAWMIQDYLKGIRQFHAVAHYLVINVSSPNTPGLRDVLTHPDTLLRPLLSQCSALNHQLHGPPLFLKISLDQLDPPLLRRIADLVVECRLHGIIVGNTTVERPEGLKSDPSLLQEPGGLSGPTLKSRHVEAIRMLYQTLPKSVAIIGCGGIRSVQDVLDYAHAGAQAVQLYTHFIFQGPSLVHRLRQDLSKYLNDHHLQWQEDVVGKDVREMQEK
ncbi:Dihydroorotate dehydrogenase (quinone), mitochondrial [Coelomomyces lativittatus]|nr:Dihydroorotate dehydrogenase (quinone), mitochondrial [Coelomomyces lativittatus]KAJ1518601.1 Dihydroorotate dehydrogenase (quinone), mitochondrial [Coelomomyces lativittatus]